MTDYRPPASTDAALTTSAGIPGPPETALANSEPEVVICWTRCEPCMFGQCFDPPKWHSWAGPEDLEHAAATGQPDPSDKPCACLCSGAGPTAEDAVRAQAALRESLAGWTPPSSAQ